MTYDQLIRHFGDEKKVSVALGVSVETVRKWEKDISKMPAKRIPWQWQCAAAWKTNTFLFPTLGPWDKAKDK